VAAFIRVERRDPHETMNSDLGHQQTVGIEPFDSDRDRFHPSFLTGLVVNQLRAVAMLLRPAEVHAQQHFGPVLRFGSAGARMNCEESVALGVFAAQQGGGFDAAQLVIQPLNLLLDVFRDVLAFAGKFEKSLQILYRALQFSIQLDIIFKLLAALQNRLRLSLIIPKTRIGDLLLDLAQFPAFGFRVKDNSECPGFGFSATEIPGSILQA